jgi:hypothetical protein
VLGRARLIQGQKETRVGVLHLPKTMVNDLPNFQSVTVVRLGQKFSALVLWGLQSGEISLLWLANAKTSLKAGKQHRDVHSCFRAGGCFWCLDLSGKRHSLGQSINQSAIDAGN